MMINCFLVDDEVVYWVVIDVMFINVCVFVFFLGFVICEILDKVLGYIVIKCLLSVLYEVWELVEILDYFGVDEGMFW